MTRVRALLEALQRAGVEFVVIGGVAANAHGSARTTFDLDVVYARDRENIRRVAAALADHQPYLRGAPPGLPFRWDEETIRHGLNFTLVTALGDLDLLGEVIGGGSYADLLESTIDVDLLGTRCRFVTLPKLIELKRAAGRPKDLEAIAELELILEEQKAQS